MGFALPAAIGAKNRVSLTRKVWVVAGDGGFQMTAGGVVDRRAEELDLNIAVVNNGNLGMVPAVAGIFSNEKNYQSTPLLSPDFVKLDGGARDSRTRRRQTF